ncbi:hypothetical protein EUA93_13605 [Nocardioides oleivorans]|uniref:DUF4430 domain-containing protein n=1 Tax=Nocardioides oleivorans TaxID=273676 RepID=A0A4Q2S0X4_9ACTN|nr:hypothetical protein [Nocardioides oleivorans]RYB95281.1 hypothetical protein EUA93_13605 [Nocardioides oleivorans]
MTTVALRRVLGALALLVAGPGFALGPAPSASAATCTSSGGVSVVVDFRELGGGVITGCAADGGGKSAAAIFQSVGITLTYAQQSPGFVCRVNGAPAADPCRNTSPANATWGLWWSDGTKAAWTYSPYGVGALTVPDGGSVGWSWQQDRPSGGAVPPGAAPPVNPASPTASPSASPTATPTGGSGASGGSGGSGSPTASPTSPGGGNGGSGGKGGKGGSGSTPSPSATPSASPTGSPSGSPSGTPSASGSPSESPSGSPSESPLASESPGDSRTSAGADDPSDDPSLGSESPGDSRTSAGSAPSDLAPESPGDSTASGASTDEPGRVPAAVTWGVVALLALAIVASALVARRRRGA